MLRPEVRVRTWVRASDDEIRRGLLGYVSVEIGNLLLDGLTVRRTAEGRLALSFPARTDRAGRRHPYVRPLDDAARQQIEHEIIKALGANLSEVIP